MGGLFSKEHSKQSRVTEHDRAVLQLKLQRDELRRQQKRINHSMEKVKEVAKKLIVSGHKDRALTLLKRKRALEKQLGQRMAQNDNIETMINDIEFAQMQNKVFDSLAAGTQSLKEMQRLVSLEDVERIMDESKEAVEYQQEIDALISGHLDDADMADVEAELDALLEEGEKEIIKLPDVPVDEPEGEREPTAVKAKRSKPKEAEMVAAS